MADRYVLVVATDIEAASTALFFSRLLRACPDRIRIVQHHRDRLVSLLAGASAVVFIRGLFEYGELVSCAGWLGIPRYYFADDHFILVREDGGPAAAFVQDHTEPNVRRMLLGFRGVLVSTAELAADFRRRALHSDLVLFPPTVIPPPPRSAPTGRTRLAFFGGSHLHDVFLQRIVPAIRRLALTRPVELIAVGVPGPIAPSDGLSVMTPPYQPSYTKGLQLLAAEGVDILIHPVAAGLRNNAFKCPHALITAHSLGAVPVVSAAPPYSEFHDTGVAILCADSQDSWYHGLLDAADDERARGIRQFLAAYCEKAFSGASNQEVWQALLDRHARPSEPTRLMRTALTAPWLLASLVRRQARRLQWA